VPALSARTEVGSEQELLVGVLCRSAMSGPDRYRTVRDQSILCAGERELVDRRAGIIGSDRDNRVDLMGC